jgi:hypothetical protein
MSYHLSSLRWKIIIIIAAMLVTTVYATTSTTTIQPTSIGDVAVSGFNVIPAFSYLLMLLSGGIAYTRSHRVAVGFFSATIIGIGIIILGSASTPPTTIVNVGAVALVAVMFVATAWFELQTRSKN